MVCRYNPALMRLKGETHAPTERTMKMFKMDNTDGFTQTDLNLMNETLEILMTDGMDESNASDRIINNWVQSGNTVKSLIG